MVTRNHVLTAERKVIKPTNNRENSLAIETKMEPIITLWGRIAGGAVGSIVSPFKPSLHFTIVIEDGREVFGIDGQPTTDVVLDLKSDYLIDKQMFKIKTNFYRNEYPTKPRIKIKILPPKGISAHVFAQELKRRAYNFASYSSEYSFPFMLGGSRMDYGEYNSSSYISGLLKSVMGYVPEISTPGYQTPGWENPLPSSYFKGEAVR